MAITLGFSAGAVLGLVADEPDRSAAMAVPLSSSVARPAAKSTAARFIETSSLLGKHARFTGHNPQVGCNGRTSAKSPIPKLHRTTACDGEAQENEDHDWRGAVATMELDS